MRQIHGRERAKFLEVAASVAVYGQPRSPDDLLPAALQAVRFTGVAVGLPDFGFKTDSPEQLKIAASCYYSAMKA